MNAKISDDRKFGIEFSIFGLFVLLTIVMTYPLILDIRSKIPGVPSSDNFAYLWKMYWFKHAIIDLGQSPLFCKDIFYPTGFNFAQDEATFINTLGLLPITWIFGEVVSLNLAVMLSFVLAGFGMYLFVKELIGCRWCAVFAGVVFAFSPYHFARAEQHLNLSTIQWIPFAFLYAERLIRYGRRRYVFGLAGFYALTALSSWYYAYYIGMMLALYVFIRVWPMRRTPELRPMLVKLAVSVLIAVIAIAPFIYPSLALHSTGTMAYKLIDVDSYSASIDDFIRPSPFHPLWGAKIKDIMSRQFTDWGEHILLAGWIAMLLALLAFGRGTGEKWKKPIIWVGAVAFILALGTTLHLSGVRLEFSAPRFLTERYGRETLPIPMPGYLLFKYMPFFNSSRVWARFGLMTGFTVAVLAAYGLLRLTVKRTEQAKKAIIALAVALACFESIALPMPMSRVAPRPVDLWFKARPEKSVILQLPDFSSGPQMYYTKYHGQYLANGCGAFLDPQFNANMFVMRSLPDSESLQTLKDMKVRYLLLNQKAFAGKWPALKRKMDKEPAVSLRYNDGEIAVYEILKSDKGDGD